MPTSVTTNSSQQRNQVAEGSSATWEVCSSNTTTTAHQGDSNTAGDHAGAAPAATANSADGRDIAGDTEAGATEAHGGNDSHLPPAESWSHYAMLHPVHAAGLPVDGTLLWWQTMLSGGTTNPPGLIPSLHGRYATNEQYRYPQELELITPQAAEDLQVAYQANVASGYDPRYVFPQSFTLADYQAAEMYQLSNESELPVGPWTNSES